MAPTSWRRGDYTISTDPRRLDLAAIHGFLARSYWAEGIPRGIVAKALRHSFCFGVYYGKKQVGFARLVTDYATYAYVADVFILEEHRALDLSKWLMEVISDHPKLQGFRRWSLVTRDAHGLYERFGFRPLARPENYMERADPNIYLRKPKVARGASARR